MAEDIVIWGAGGQGREVRLLLNDINAAGPAWNFLGFLVDDEFRATDDPEILGGADWLRTHPGVNVVIAIGDPVVRKRLALRLAQTGVRFPSLRHPSALVGADAVIGDGAIICAGAVATTGVRIGAHAHVNIGAMISHDVVLGEFATLGPGVNVAGRAELGEGVWLGVGANVLPDARIGDWSIIGGGAVVTKPVPSHVVAAGVPARLLRSRAGGPS